MSDWLQPALRLQEGDDSALEPLIVATQTMGFRFARTLLQDQHLCEDVMQEAYCIVYREIGTLRDVRAFKTWFLRIVGNCCHKARRKRAREDVSDPPDTAAPGNVEGDVTGRLALRQMLQSLSPQDRRVLMLREVVQCTYEEIAAALRIPIGTVRSRLRDARRRLLQLGREVVR